MIKMIQADSACYMLLRLRKKQNQIQSPNKPVLVRQGTTCPGCLGNTDFFYHLRLPCPRPPALGSSQQRQAHGQHLKAIVFLGMHSLVGPQNSHVGSTTQKVGQRTDMRTRLLCACLMLPLGCVIWGLGGRGPG